MTSSAIESSTIVALATAEGKGALAMLRLSGGRAIPIINTCFSKQLQQQASHTLHVGKILDKGEVVDEVVVGLFRGPRSYTGEDLVEISCHGSPYVVRRLLQLFCKAGAQVAAAGEFTKRAFLYGKLDLAQAEGVASLIAAESEAAHKVALGQMQGGTSRQIQAFSQEIVAFAAQLELELDFSEEDLQFVSRTDLCNRLQVMRARLQALMSSFSTAQAFKEGIDVVIAGPPNVGKSTLFNALVADEKAMVSPIAGTTRDYIEGYLTIKGTRFRLTDTAGLRNSTDTLEQEGIRRTQTRIAAAQILLLVADAATCNKAQLIKLRTAHQHPNRVLLLVGNKADLLDKTKKTTLKKEVDLLLSAKQQTALQQLCDQMYAQTLGQGKHSSVWISEARHYELLLHAENALKRVQEGLDKQQNTELLAADLREALRALGKITGEVYSEALLTHIFSRFCIGK